MVYSSNAPYNTGRAHSHCLNVSDESHVKKHGQRAVSMCGILRKLWQRAWTRSEAAPLNIPKNVSKAAVRKAGNANAVAAGFANSSNNCWINALLQLIKSVPAYDEAYRTIAHEAIAAGNQKSVFGRALLNAFARYDTALAAQTPVSSAVSQAVRRAFHHLISVDISIDASEQYDAYEALMHMMRCYAEIQEMHNRPLPSNLFTPVLIKRQYAPKEVIATDRSYTKISDDLTTEDKQFEFQMILPLQGNFDQRTGECSFDTLLKSYFDNPRVVESDPMVFQGTDHKVRKYQPISERRQFSRVPEQFTIVLNRTGMSRERGVYKIDVPVEVPREIVLNTEATGAEHPVYYRFVSAIFHSGPYGGGHYIAVKAVGNHLVELNDGQSKFVGNNHMVNIQNQWFPFTGYVYHYVKIDGK